MIQRMLLICMAGAAGTLCRYALARFTYRLTGAGFPWGTLAVNAVGCFTAGLLWSLFEHRWSINDETRIIVLVGFLGAFTTFSTYMLETGELLKSTHYAAAAGNLFLQNGIGIIAILAGASLGRMT